MTLKSYITNSVDDLYPPGKVVRLAGQKDGKPYAVEAASGDHCKMGNWVVCRDGVS